MKRPLIRLLAFLKRHEIDDEFWLRFPQVEARCSWFNFCVLPLALKFWLGALKPREVHIVYDICIDSVDLFTFILHRWGYGSQIDVRLTIWNRSWNFIKDGCNSEWEVCHLVSRWV